MLHTPACCSCKSNYLLLTHEQGEILQWVHVVQNVLTLLDLRQGQMKQRQQAGGILSLLVRFTDLYSPCAAHHCCPIVFPWFPSPPFVPAPHRVWSVQVSPLRCDATPWPPVSAAPETRTMRKQFVLLNHCNWYYEIYTLTYIICTHTHIYIYIYIYT